MNTLTTQTENNTDELTRDEQVRGGSPDETETINSLRKQVSGLENELRQTSAREEMFRLFSGAGVRSPGLLFQAARDSFQFADDGTLANAAALVESLKREYPEQFGAPTASASIDASAGASPARSLTREALAKMSPEQIAKLDWAEVRQVLSQPPR